MCTSIVSNRKKTVVSMVFDVGARTVYWCEDRRWDDVKSARLGG